LEIKITILIDNNSDDGLFSEHGFALWIEAGGDNILFDTGQSQAALENNAKALGIDLAQTDKLVLSHGHYDHTGGLPAVLRQNQKVHVYCHPTALRSRYSIRDGQVKSVQMPYESVIALNELPDERLHWLRNTSLLNSMVRISGPIPRRTKYENAGGPFYLDPTGRKEDIIEDDIALWLRTSHGIIVCFGCAHAGLINTLKYGLELNRDLQLNTIIGGFHLLEASRERMDKSISALNEFGFKKIIPCHCTGEQAKKRLEEVFRERVNTGRAGTVFTFQD